MDWWSAAKDFGVPALVAAGVSGFIGWLCKRNLEKYKQALSADREQEKERLKHDLRMAAIEHGVRFIKIHERRVEVIAELYRRIDRARSDFAFLASPFGLTSDPTKQEQMKTAVDALIALSEFFHQNRVYLRGSISERVDGLLSKLKDVDFFMRRQLSGRRPPETAGSGEAAPKDYWDKAHDIMRKEVPQILDTITHDFHSILGISDQ